MSNDLPAAGLSWRRSRYGFAGFWFLSLLVVWFLLRVVLLIAFKPPGLSAGRHSARLPERVSPGPLCGLAETIPLLFWMLIVPDRRFGARWHRVLFLGGCFVFWFVQIFLLFVEFFFFDEFKSRFNTVAVDYLLYPREVFINIWESYHVGVVLARLRGPEPGLAVRGEPAVCADVGAALLRQSPGCCIWRPRWRWPRCSPRRSISRART